MTEKRPSSPGEVAYDKATAHPLASIVLTALHEQDALSYHGRGSEEIGERALGVVKAIEDAGFTILRTKSYRAAQERQRVAEVMREMAEEDKRTQREWMERDVFPWERHLVNRLNHVAALAKGLGATAEDFVGPPCNCGKGQCAKGSS